MHADMYFTNYSYMNSSDQSWKQILKLSQVIKNSPASPSNPWQHRNYQIFTLNLIKTFKDWIACQLASMLNFILSSKRLMSGLISDAILGATALTNRGNMYKTPTNATYYLKHWVWFSSYTVTETFYINIPIIYINIIQLQFALELI